MFIRVKSTPNSPRKSVQICENVREGIRVRQHVIRHVGIAQNDIHLTELKQLAKTIKAQMLEERDGPFLWAPEIDEQERRPVVCPTGHATQSDSVTLTGQGPEDAPPLSVDLKNLREKQRIVEGFHDVFGKLFSELGFQTFLGKKHADVLQDVLLARIASPASKHATQAILAADFGREIPLERIYRMMDALILHKEEIQKRIFSATEQLCFGGATILLFDVTTFYFESIEVDELRNFGFSKDQQFHTTQVVVALATTSDGLPVGYRLFAGNTAEISTLLACLNEWRRTLSIGQVIFVGDRGMMSEKNLQALEQANVTYVVGAKMKKMSLAMQKQILAGPRQSKETKAPAIQDHVLENGRRLVVSHTFDRATKDQKDRERGIGKIRKKIGKGKNLKKLIPNYGYQKFLKTEGDGQLTLDEEKIAREEAWDGFHGVMTNALDKEVHEILAHYSRLWVIEESFRIQKHHLSMRPIYHFKSERIESHILLCYMAFTMIRHLEFRMEKQQTKVTIDEMRHELWRVQSSILQDQVTKKWYRIPSAMPLKAKKMYQVFGIKHTLQPHELKK